MRIKIDIFVIIIKMNQITVKKTLIKIEFLIKKTPIQVF